MNVDVSGNKTGVARRAQALAREGEGLPLPAYMSEHAAGADLCAAVDAGADVCCRGRGALVPTGFSIALPLGYEAQVRPRSGLAIRSGVTCLNAPGTIDADYRGEVGVVLANLGSEPVVICRGDRIAQLVVAPVARAAFDVVDELPPTRSRRRRLRFDGPCRSRMKVYIVGKRRGRCVISATCCESVGVEVDYAPRSIDDVRSTYDADVALVTTKAYDTDGRHRNAAKSDRASRKDACSFLPKTASATKKSWRPLSAPTTSWRRRLRRRLAAIATETYARAKEGGSALAPMGANAYNWLVATFAGTGLNVKVVGDWRALKWSKLALNVGRECKLRDSQRPAESARALREGLHARDSDDSGSASGDAGDEGRADRFAALSRARALQRRRACRARSRAVCWPAASRPRAGRRPPSLLIDLRNGKPQTEVDVLNGAVAARRPPARSSDPGQCGVLPGARRHRTHAASVGEVPRTSRHARSRSALPR